MRSALVQRIYYCAQRETASQLSVKIVMQRGVCTGLVWYQNSKSKLFTDELHYCRVVWLANQIYRVAKKKFQV